MSRVCLLSLAALLACARANSDPAGKPAGITDDANTVTKVTTTLVTGELGKLLHVSCSESKDPTLFVFWYRGHGKGKLLKNDAVYEMKRNALLIRSLAIDTLGPYTCQAYNSEDMTPLRIFVVRAYIPDGTRPPDSDWLLPRGTGTPSPGTQLPSSAEMSTLATMTTTEASELNDELEVTAFVGGIAILRSLFNVQDESWMETLPPKIWWDFGDIKIDGNTDRYRLLSDGALEIVSLGRNDTGVYSFTALNMFGIFTQKIHLVVNDTVRMPAGIAGDENAVVTGYLGSLLQVRCLAYGYPPPCVFWYSGFDEEAMVLYNDTNYETSRNVLTIKSLNQDTLGAYTCGAYNGVGQAALWKVIVRINMLEDPLITENDLTQPGAQPSTTVETATTGLLSSETSTAGGLIETTQETTEAFSSETSARSTINEGTTEVIGTTTLDSCSSFEFGCCADNETEASGPDGQGCPCNATEFGCRPDGVSLETSTVGGLTEAKEAFEVETSARSTTNEGTTGVIGTTTLDLCSSFEFGCCADNETEASGPDGQGCPCNATEFGCCPDGVSAAAGRESDGCPVPCSKSPYGCCQDEKSPAHGRDFEGCCLLQAFGCCPDNRRPAKGANVEGCGCQDALHGCCPDNVTIAQGPDNQGCGCQYTEYGCCPDRHTAASGPYNEGCTCNTYQFGCCADGVTTATGPEQQGCHCRESKFGCCGDGETPAVGPDGAGCDCSSGRHGCCPDGRTEATGPKFLGCTDAPENKQAACSMSTDPGPCHNFTPMWYYDLAYGGCSRFWYGGCDGNGNRFSSKEECEDVCVQPSPKDACKLPSVKGACEADYQHWHYNSTLEQCIPFRYGGCLGNANNFETRELCQKQCEPSSVAGQCNLPIDQGLCAGNYSRWGFNSDAHRCEHFIWGGCEGNSNRFSSEAACQMRCAGTHPPQCTQPQDAGKCTQKEALWSFSQSENRCLPFYYSGCGGNDNRFSSREACEQTCPSAFVADKCTLPAETGQCSNYRERWFYDTTFKRCRQFYYGGCGGNENNFGTEAECESSCSEIKTTTTTTTTTTTASPVEPQPEPRPHGTDQRPAAPERLEFCFNAIDAGPCNNTETRYAYDSELGRCVTFQYGGCGGNQNNFPDEDYCSYYCQPMQDICQLPMLQGPCDDSLMRWFYDPTSDSCSQFTFGGCDGNGNRFESLEACENRCRTGPAPVAPTTTTTTVIVDLASECKVPEALEDCRYGGVVWFFDPSRHDCVSYANQEAGPACRHTGTFSSQEACERSCEALRGVDVPAAPLALPQLKPEVLASEGGSATLRCLFQGNPPPKITWKIGELAIDGNEGRYRLMSDGALEIVSLNRNDTGVHICVADNGLGVAKQAIHLVVNDVPAAPLALPQPESEVTASEGGSATLRCLFHGNPPPKITWRFGELTIDGNADRYRLMSDGALQIVSLYRNDTGIYICVADNGLGVATQEVHLAVNDPVRMPVGIAGDEDAVVSGKLGSPLEVRCLAYGYPPPSVFWYRGNNGIMVPYNNAVYLARGNILLIRSLANETLGEYTCQAYNGEGKAASWVVFVRAYQPEGVLVENELLVPRNTLPPRTQPPTTAATTTSTARTTTEAPRPLLTVPVSTHVSTPYSTLNSGADLRLTCDVDGFPEPDVHWTKDGATIQADGRITITGSTIVSRLTVARVSDADSGLYACHASNQYSSQSDTAQINVKQLVVPAECTDFPFFANCELIVLNKFCKHSYYSKFCCKSCVEAGLLDPQEVDYQAIQRYRKKLISVTLG